jgi:hypothetical protein
MMKRMVSGKRSGRRVRRVGVELVSGYSGDIDDALHALEVGVERVERHVYVVLWWHFWRSILLPLRLLLLLFLLLWRNGRRNVEISQRMRWFDGNVENLAFGREGWWRGGRVIKGVLVKMGFARSAFK